MLGVSSGYLTQLLWEALQFLPSKQGVVYTVVSLFVQVALLLLAVLLLYRYVPRELIDALDVSHLPPPEPRKTTATLEDVFVSLTGRTLRDE